MPGSIAIFELPDVIRNRVVGVFTGVQHKVDPIMGVSVPRDVQTLSRWPANQPTIAIHGPNLIRVPVPEFTLVRVYVVPVVNAGKAVYIQTVSGAVVF